MKRPIGFIDSGVGGLTVLKEALKQLPNESMIFLGDSARMGLDPKRKFANIRWKWCNFYCKRI